jgi:hypothetical protein
LFGKFSERSIASIIRANIRLETKPRRKVVGYKGRAMAQETGRRPLTAGSGFANWSSFGICGGQWHLDRVLPSSSVSPCHYHSIIASYSFINWEMSKRPVCGRSWLGNKGVQTFYLARFSLHFHIDNDIDYSILVECFLLLTFKPTDKFLPNFVYERHATLPHFKFQTINITNMAALHITKVNFFVVFTSSKHVSQVETKTTITSTFHILQTPSLYILLFFCARRRFTSEFWFVL